MKNARPILRGVPLAALVAITVALVALRISRGDRSHATGPLADEPSSPPSAVASAAGAPSWPARSFSVIDGGASLGTVARTFHGDARHLHRGRGHGPKSVQVAWKSRVGGAVAAQTVVSPDGATLYVVTLEGSLVALDAKTGEKKWSAPLGDRAYGAPTVADDGTIWVGSDSKHLFSFKPTGEKSTTLDLPGEADSAPLRMADGSMAIAAGDTVTGVSARGDVTYAFRAGKKVYSAPTWAPGGRVIFGSQDHKLYALDPSGKQGYFVDLGADVDGSPATLDDGSAIVGTDGADVVKVDPKGVVAWRTNVGGYVRGGVTITRSGDIVVGTFGPVPRVVRLAPDGAKLGAFEIQGTGARDFGIWGSPIEDDDGDLYFGAEDDHVYGLDPRGSLLFTYKTDADVDAPVTMLEDGSLVFGSEDGTVTRLRP